MDDESLLSTLSTEALERLESVDSDPLCLPEPWKTIVVTYSVQGIIDNGGFTYFFENDWPNNKPYEEFALAYDRIRKHDMAKVGPTQLWRGRPGSARHASWVALRGGLLERW